MTTNNKEEILDSYIPYGEEWEKEMMKLPKKFLIDMIRKNKSDAKQEAIEFHKFMGDGFKQMLMKADKKEWIRLTKLSLEDKYSLWEQTKG